jgi:squalene monooxygenase
MAQVDRIVGELMQPGGIRCLERLGLGDCAKNNIDGIAVEGYACIIPEEKAGGSKNDESTPEKCVLLSYPNSDPSNLLEHFGLVAPVPDVVPGAPPADISKNVCPVTGVDDAPRGRSFHNHKFVQKLRETMLTEPNIKVCCIFFFFTY